MKKLTPETYSYIFSISLHIIFFVMLVVFKFSPEPIEEEYITLGFGSSGIGGINQARAEKHIEAQEKEEEKVELPKTKNTDNDNNILSKKDEKKENKPQSLVQDFSNSDNEEEGFGDGGEGFSIDFGGRGKRKIYHHPLPQYPDGVAKEIDIRLRFTISADGTVGRIIPLIKADSRLETAAINSLSQWRFEPLPKHAKQIEQTVVITFPYRLR